MFRDFPIPPGFSLIQKGKVFLLIRETYKDYLLQQGIEDLQSFLRRNKGTIRYWTGRTPHPSVPIGGGRRIVVRFYSHGGLLQAFSKGNYLLGSRSFRELVLTEAVRSSGIATIEPIAAIHQFVLFPFYRASLLSLEIPEAMNLIQYFQKIGNLPSPEDLISKRRTIRSCALLLRRFHQAGFFHGDLQLKNILIVEGQPFLIDFDRSYRRPMLSIKERMRNLFRLNRSAEKWKRLELAITRTDRLRFFLAYSGDDINMWETMRRALRTYSLRSFLYRCRWTIEKIVRTSNPTQPPLI